MEESTRTLKLLQSIGRGFRPESINRGNLKDIILFEFREKGNIDILLYSSQHYGLNLWNVTKRAYQHKGLDFEAYCVGLAIVTKQNGKELSLNEIIMKLLPNEAGIFADEVIRCLSKATGTSNLSGIWLTTKTAAEKISEHGEENLKEYAIPEGAKVVCDLNEAGILFCFN